MINNRITAFAVTLSLTVSFFASIPRACAIGEQEKAAAENLLISAPWRFSAGRWSNIRIFKKGGSFTTVNRPNESGRWRFSNNTLVLSFMDGHQDVVTLPLDPKHSTGLSANGDEMTVVQEAPAAAPTAPAFGSTGPMSAMDFDAQKNQMTDMITSSPWKFSAGRWTNVRLFKKDGTFTTLNRPNESGHWRLAADGMTLTFRDGHKDMLNLPIKPQGSKGFSQEGEPMTAVQQGATADDAGGSGQHAGSSDAPRNADQSGSYFGNAQGVSAPGDGSTPLPPMPQ